MFDSKAKKAKKKIKETLEELQMNLSNNYKDLAIDAKKRASEEIERYHNSGELKDKDYFEFKRIIDDYEQRMVGYHH